MKLSPREIKKLKAYVSQHKLNTKPTMHHESMRVKGDCIFMVLYENGTLVFEETQAMSDILEYVLERKSESKLYIGTDETGKGEWYGPLVVVGTLMSSEQIKELRKIGVKDSKILSHEQITILANRLLQMNIVRCSRVILPETYNRLFKELSSEGKNSNDMLAWAHSEVVKDLIEKAEGHSVEVIIDKFDFMKTESRLSSKERKRQVDQSKINVIQMEKGEREIPVAAASIIAKHIFEDELRKLSEKYKIDFKAVSPETVPREILPMVAKMNFKNIKKLDSPFHPFT
jgi:ribonuclease HIII